ncbi:hypothetical protein GO988_22645 [Hymenobacter sp. HMF4947]|uniref:T9SS type A sorting domain-containing protein n=1 Tax=Hymenobacter ginkgonis TaxID=2682976 RepID=A0A7K1TL46_9BACT|nr:hypothetical protein [Hymenobacter ginkgonis]MVN79139.1 hypothetical protein [Hymenobacter ginkgonis]
MRPLIYFRSLAILLLWLGTLLAAHASHVVGQELTYTPIASTTPGVPRYRVKVILYRDINGVDQFEILLTCAPNGCATTGAFTRTVLRNQATSLYSLGCPTAPAYAYNVYTFETDVDLPRGQWTLSVNSENRAANIRNLVNSVNTSAYVSAFLDNSLVAQNSSPKFLSTLLPYLCGSQAQRYSFSAFDVEGDSLVYSFVYPQQGIQPANQCGAPIPGALLSPHFQLNAATGALVAQAGSVQQGRYAMAARVSEYRQVNGRWQQVGYVTRDITYLAFDAANANPHFTSLTLNAATTPQPVEQLLRVQPGQTVTLKLSATDPDAGQTLRFASQAPDVIPGFSLATTGANQAQLTWQVPATLPLGRYTATVAVLDNGCPVASEEQTISFLVTTQVLATLPPFSAATAAFPMPFHEQVQFQAIGSQAITICDELGRVVARFNCPADGHVVWAPAPTLPAGLYVARGADGRLLARLLRAAN